ncbi:hypothetical protein [Streptomyces sp. NPDC015345]|uniref:hypothetical protein n=1 Tax=Streptomyces sp. NPDC015345 TaxID=3364953 RepID=UPI0036F6FB7F
MLLKPNVDYLFRTSAYDGGLYETEWSPWARMRIELPVDLTLPNPDHNAPHPSFTTPPNSQQTKPLKSATARSTYKADKRQCGRPTRTASRRASRPTRCRTSQLP